MCTMIFRLYNMCSVPFIIYYTQYPINYILYTICNILYTILWNIYNIYSRTVYILQGEYMLKCICKGEQTILGIKRCPTYESTYEPKSQQEFYQGTSSHTINTIVFTGIVAFTYSSDVNESVISYIYPLFQPYKPLSIDRI